jgi:ribosome-binding protein aMBF1 (putative translation factor)
VRAVRNTILTSGVASSRAPASPPAGGVAAGHVDRTSHSLAAMPDLESTARREARRWHVSVTTRHAAARLLDPSSAAGTIGHRIRQLREAAGLSQRQLAERTGTTQSAVARLEADRQEPTLRTLEKLASALGQDLVVVLPGTETS